MKIQSILLCFLGSIATLRATEYFSGSGGGASLEATPPYRVYFTPWINTLTAEIGASSRVSPTDRSNAVAVVNQLAAIASQRGVAGTFSRSAGNSHGTIQVDLQTDYVVGSGYVTGSGFSVFLSLDTPTAAAPNAAPSVDWSSAPGSAASGQSYTIAAHGHDADGNLAQVNVWKNGAAFAFAGGGNGTDGSSGNTTSDSAAGSVVFTAQAVDAAGATSPMISHTVTVSAPANRAPSIAWSSIPGSAAHQQSYTVNAIGSDADGNLTQVNIWKNGVPFAFGGGGSGYSGSTGNPTSDNGPQTVTFTAQAVDSSGATSPVISQTVVIAAPPNQPPVVTLLSPSGPTVVIAGTTLAISTRATDANGNLTNHNIDILRPAGDWNFQGGFATGEPYQGGPVGSAANSTRTASFTFSNVGTYTIRSAANDGSGWVYSSSVTITVTPAAPVNHAPTIAWLSTPGTVGNLQTYTVSARGQDSDGNLTQVNIWKSGAGFGFAGGGNGFVGDSANATADSGPRTITFTAQAVDASGATSAMISQTVTVNAPANAAPTIAWISAPSNVNSGQSYTISARGSDVDGNLSSVTILKDGSPFTTAGAGNGSTSDASGGTSDVGPRTVTFTAVARDAAGASSGTITQVVTVGSPAPSLFALTTMAGSGGGVSPGGTFASGTSGSASATPDAIHDFTGWSGDVSGIANPVSVLMDRNKTIQANFALKTFALTTSASGGGSVTSGGVYSYGTTVTLSATANPTSRFTGWAGDASGTTPSIAIVMTTSKSVQAFFAVKASQSISFPVLADQSSGAGPLALTATATSGLPITYVVLSGPATVSGSQLQLSAPGGVTIEARQAGNEYFLPAPSVTRSFNIITAPAVVKYHPAARTVLRGESNLGTAPFVIEKP